MFLSKGFVGLPSLGAHEGLLLLDNTCDICYVVLSAFRRTIIGRYIDGSLCICSLVLKANALSWRTFCEPINRADMCHHLPRLLKFYRRLQAVNLRMQDDEWTLEEEAKANILATRFFPSGRKSDCFKVATTHRVVEILSLAR